MNLPSPSPDLFELYQKKQKNLLDLFHHCRTPDAVYEQIIAMGRSLPKPESSLLKNKTNDYLVKGCQSLVFLFSQINTEGKVVYSVDSDALISSGLAALLLFIYQGEKPEFILFCPPLFIEELKLNTSLSPGRSNGLASMYARMKQDALKLFLKNQIHPT